MKFRPRNIIINTALTALLLAGFVSVALAGAPLQLFIELTPVGQILRPIPGVYTGPITINKSIIIDGQGEVIIDGQGKGTLITINADSVTIRNCKFINSGNSHDQVDAAILITSDGSLIENNIIENTLFGVHISQGNNNIVRNNSIVSKDADSTLRGEGIRMWYSRGNLIENNKLDKVRDMVLTNSIKNIISGNTVKNSRMGLELVFSPDNEICGNTFSGNEHGIVGIYSDSLHIHHNRIEHQNNLQGSAIAVKGSSQSLIEYNEILDCAVGLTANSPLFPENILYLKNNHFAYNDVAMYFYGEKGGHVIHGNSFAGNFQQVAVTGPTSALANDWLGNYWQDYQGFDQDGDGIGDTPYEVYLFSERIWMERSMAKFFRGSPVLELVDFAERLTPFSEPKKILQDPKPRIAH